MYVLFENSQKASRAESTHMQRAGRVFEALS